jgi:hypothetical protein
MEQQNKQDKLDIPQMIARLDQLYERKEQTDRLIKAYIVLSEQLQEDIELAEQMIMYASNKKARAGGV